VAQVFATIQRRMHSAISVAVASGSLVDYLPSRRTPNRRTIGCRTSSIQCVGPSRFFELIRMSTGRLSTNLTFQIL
jgi:hypothetical protein